MFRHILLAAVVVVAGVSFSMKSVARNSVGPIIQDDRWTHWPWRLAQPFPWSEIQGIWKVDQGSNSTYFVFKVVKQKNGVRQLQVKQVDGGNCKVVATGAGLEKNQRVLAQVTNKAGHTYRVNLTAFRASDVSEQAAKGSIFRDSVMVLSMGDLDQNSNDDMVHTQIMKVSEQLDLKACTADLKN